MLNRRRSLLILITCLGMLWLGVDLCLAQTPIAEIQRMLREKGVFDRNEVTALDQGEAVSKVLPADNKREIAMCGMARIQAPAERFLQSFRENMTRRSNPAVLEIGSFSNPPSLDDFQTLTIVDRDIDDLRQCVVGNCDLKLSATMIERLQNEVDWTAENYRLQVTQLLKQMLVDYARDYLARADTALIQYADKAKRIHLADEQDELIAGSSYKSLAENPNQPSKFDLEVVENALVWSKIKFGLKPVIAINHIKIYKSSRTVGTQILILSKQIYANHYFDSSIALTAFLNVPGPTSGSYLFYENRSRLDGLEGPFGKIKRRLIEDKALGSLNSILHQSQLNLAAPDLNSDNAAAPVEQNWRRWKIRRVHIFILLFCITGFTTLLAARAYGWKGGMNTGTHY